MSDLPAGASEGDGNFDTSPELGGFVVQFSIPFSRTDVYKELLVAEGPLGSSPNVTFTIRRPGIAGGQPISPGCVRAVEFGAPFHGTTVSELTVAEKGTENGPGFSAVKWRQLESTTRLNLLGDGTHLPEFTVTLEGSKSGTLVKLYYNFSKVDMKGPLFCFSSCMPNLLKWHLTSTISNVWHMEMVRRGYIPEKKPVFGNITADKSEEAEIKARAANGKAGASKCLKCLV